MAFKPNYNHERAERNRAKAAKAEKKAREREEKAALRKAPGEGNDAAPEEESAE
ncbi:hypothetical protein [uncultured Parvibaculum sp.]|uniref:hypothetical protein n=1 Tax=uncultured Parvibaculum sp. TaxID=291828 RepID=UPI0030DA6E72|tara:strand:- start:114494 stop:114655 length:162 start_codon:yes stop_codon:yes gene_type:complete